MFQAFCPESAEASMFAAGREPIAVTARAAADSVDRNLPEVFFFIGNYPSLKIWSSFAEPNYPAKLTTVFSVP
jgi:hypothetical protein